MIRLNVLQANTIINDAIKGTLGEEAISNLDLSTGVVDIGVKLANADLYEHFIYDLAVGVHKVIFESKVYQKKLPNIKREAFDYGLLTYKIRVIMPEVQPNQSWQLANNTSYDDNVFVKSQVEVEIFKNQSAYEVRLSIPDTQLNQAFTSYTELTGFVNLLFQSCYNKLEKAEEDLTRLCFLNVVAETIYDDYGASAQSSKSGVKAINLLYLYNQTIATPLSVAEALQNEAFMRFANTQMRLYAKYMKEYTNLFNVNKEMPTFANQIGTLMLAEFDAKLESYLYSTTYHDEYVKLGSFDTISWWQNSNSLDFANISKLQITTASGHQVTYTGVVALMYDMDMLGIASDGMKITQHNVKSAEFKNLWFKEHVRYYNDLNENAVVFFIA